MFRRQPEDEQREEGEEHGGHRQDVRREHHLAFELELEAEDGVAVTAGALRHHGAVRCEHEV